MSLMRGRRVLILSFVLAIVAQERRLFAQLAEPRQVIPLYSSDAPGSENWSWSERKAGSTTNPTIQNVVHPELLYYPADKSAAVGTAMIVAPGGGFQNLMMSYEGVDIARKLNSWGIDAFVLKYRLKFTPARQRDAATRPVMPLGAPATQEITDLASQDGEQAVRLVRSMAGQFGYRANRVGMIGFSAGGKVLVAAIHSPPETRPDFACAIYAGGGNADPAPVGARPLFIAVAADDQSVGYLGALDLFNAWRTAGAPVELHIFQIGRHGFQVKGGGADHFMDRVQEWLKVNGELSKPN
jgi:dienelactone hydrolase